MDTDYEWGKSGKLRASRDYLGVSALEMAQLLRIARRSYQRMETGDSAIPKTIWADIAALHDRQDQEVDTLVSKIGQRPVSVAVGTADPKWRRTVLARVARRCPGIAPCLPDDIEVMKEISDGPDSEVPITHGAS